MATRKHRATKRGKEGLGYVECIWVGSGSVGLAFCVGIGLGTVGYTAPCLEPRGSGARVQLHMNYDASDRGTEKHQ